MSDLFNLIEHLLKQGECQCKGPSINSDEIVKPDTIQIHVNRIDHTKILISGTFIDINGKKIKGRPMEMDIVGAMKFASCIVDACEQQAECLSEDGDDE